MFKRLIDILGALMALLLFSPILVVTSIAVMIKMGRPILFLQARPGLNGKPFVLVKFRTMLDEVDGSGTQRPDAERLTEFGRLLRSTSLDELPEFWNVLIGDMSLVGPRPLLTAYLPLYTRSQARRHEMRPGITGWAQINGRNLLNWEEKFRLDVWYVDNQSLWLDAKVLVLTLRAVFDRRGISARNEATMACYTGPAHHDRLS